MSATLNRRAALTVVAAVPAAAALSVPALASVGEDAELKELWAAYLAQFRAYRAIEKAYQDKRRPLDAEMEEMSKPLEAKVFDGLWRKYKLEPLCKAATREHRKLVKITRAIRRAKAEGLFGIGVKLSVSEDFAEWDPRDAADDARRAIAEITGVDFLQTGALTEEALS